MYFLMEKPFIGIVSIMFVITSLLLHVSDKLRRRGGRSGVSHVLVSVSIFRCCSSDFTPHLVPHLVSSLHKIRYVVVELVEYTGDDEVDVDLDLVLSCILGQGLGRLVVEDCYKIVKGERSEGLRY